MKGITLILGVLAVLLMLTIFPYATADTTTITVVDKERITKKESSKYLVFTENETFENTDCFVRLKWNSSDIQGQLRIGETYTVNVYGWRVPFLSAYRNIVSIAK